MKTLVANFYAGPGTGKSTICAGVFSKLKWRGVNCEMALEYAKDVVWEGSVNKFDNQLYIFAKQYHRVFRLMGKVDVILTDCPILMSLVYSKGDENEKLRELILDKYNDMQSLDIFLTRQKDYNPAGRMQTLEQAKQLDDEIRDVLAHHSQMYATYEGIQASEERIAETIMQILGK